MSSRIGRNPFEKETASQSAATSSKKTPLEKPLPISKQLIEEAIQEARREEALAKARVAGKPTLSFFGRVAGWIAVDLVAESYVMGLRALLFAKEVWGGKGHKYT
jgi:hypothetical protein